MARLSVSLSRAVALAAVAAAASALLLVWLGLRPGAEPAPWIGWGLAGLVAAAVIGMLAGSRTASELRALRRLLSAWARGELAEPRRPGLIREVRQVGHAADLLVAHLDRRASRFEQQSAQLTTLVETVSDGLLRVGPGGTVEFLNPAARVLLGLPPSAVGQPISALIRSLELRRLIERALQEQHVAGTEVTLGERRVLVAAQALGKGQDAEHGEGAVVALSDLTTLRRLEGVRRDFVANVSHELKTPLTSIRGYVDTLLTDEPSSEVRQQFLQVIQRNAARLQRIVDELLDLSMIESGAWQPQLQAVSAAEIVLDVWTSFRDQAEQRAISFVPPENDRRIRVDPSALRQVLGNLFDNALRHTSAGGRVVIRIGPARIRSRQPAPGGTHPDHAGRDLVAVEVTDNGSGIPHDALPRIFERFYRVDPARSRARGGTGLGLAIVKHMVEGMGGSVEAESELGKGTTIRCYLPAA